MSDGESLAEEQAEAEAAAVAALAASLDGRYVNGVLTLVEPISLTGIGEVTEFRFKDKLKAKHWRALPVSRGLTYDNILHLTGKLTGQPDKVLDELGFEDLQNVVAIVSDFLATGSPTKGGTRT